jgi:hypothetical protein
MRQSARICKVPGENCAGGKQGGVAACRRCGQRRGNPGDIARAHATGKTASGFIANFLMMWEDRSRNGIDKLEAARHV